MLLELILLGLVGYLLLVWHRKEVEKGKDGLGAAGPILEELESVVFKIIDILKKQYASSSLGSANQPSTSTAVSSEEAPTQRPSPRVTQVEKFESVRQPREPKSRSKHHSKHRSKMDSALKAAQK